tara:strand:- start:74 stop:625 length:552 start_codon:yes stop_codon:yes gene_type:complete
MNPVNESTVWQKLAKRILNSKFGLMQLPQRYLQQYGSGAEAELRSTVPSGKADLLLSQKTASWLRNQTDYNPIATVYKNAEFGDDPCNAHFRRLVERFWEVYSKEELTWRDQPLWSYFVASEHVVPIRYQVAPGHRQGKKGKLGHDGHKYQRSMIDPVHVGVPLNFESLLGVAMQFDTSWSKW